MARFGLIAVWIVVLFARLSAAPAAAQDFRPEFGDPPVAARISIDAPDADGIVRIDGAQGSVFGNATVAVRNLYTGETVYTVAGGLGSWTARLYGPGETPFWISPNQGGVPEARQAIAGSLPGGPGVIVYGLPSATTQTGIITQIALDGFTDEWALYPVTNIGEARALVNNDSLYIALASTFFLLNYETVEIIFTIDTITYGVRFDPRRLDTPQLRQLNPGTADFGALPAAYRLNPITGGALEVRIPLDFVDRALRLTFNGARWLDASGAELSRIDVGLNVLQVDERDGIVRPVDATDRAGALLFDAGGQISAVNGAWTARGRAIHAGRSGNDVLSLAAGDVLHMEMDVRLTADALPPSARIIARIHLQPIARLSRSTGDGDPIFSAVSDNGTNFGWTSLVTASGMPIDNVDNGVDLGTSGTVTVEPHQIVGAGGVVFFPMDFEIALPDDLTVGLYVPVFEGAFALPDGTIRPWNEADAAPTMTRLPLVFNTGVATSVPLPWALLIDTPSDGARGILPDDADMQGALSNRVRFNPPTYILPPQAPGDDDFTLYTLEPYLPTLLPNRYASSSAPLIPLRLPGGQIVVRITRPDGTTDDIGVVPVVQSALSSSESDEASPFGVTSPVDIYRLTTLNPRLTAYAFDQYGEYRIELRGEVSDRFGNRYTGGGSYRVLIAEPLDLVPAVLPGTPFETGDTFHPGAHIYPSVPANVTITLRVYPLDGSPVIERTFTGRANRFGVLADRLSEAEAPFMFETPGEYTIDYETRYTGADGRQWASSARTAGVIAARAERDIVAHGSRLAFGAAERRAWYTVDDPTTAFPYHSGDVLWSVDDLAARVRPVLRIQDVTRTYERWLLAALDPTASIDGVSLERRAVEDELPLGVLADTAEPSYSYLSAVRPGVSARQLIDGSLSMVDPGWTPDDPFNRQIGAGFGGDRPGDFTFLFGGAILRYADAAGLPVRAAAIYGSLLVTISADDPRGTRVYPPGRGAAGAGDGGALVTVRDDDSTLFFHPTSIRPGDILRAGDVFSLAGQVAPPLGARVSAVITAPSGAIRQIDGAANRVGYFYDPATRFIVDEAGVWTVDLVVQHEGRTSAGVIEPPYPTGSVLGADGGRFYIYVLASDLDVLDWNPRLTDTLIPPAVAYNFSFTLPTGWRDLRARYTVTTPGYIVDEGEIRLSGRSFTYLYNPSVLSERYDFLENITRSPAQLGATRAHVTDQRILTFYASGIDEGGALRSVARTFLLWYDRLISLD